MSALAWLLLPLQADGATDVLRRLREGPWTLEALGECERIATSLEGAEAAALRAALEKGEGSSPRLLLLRARLRASILGPAELGAELERLHERFPGDPPTLFFLGKARLEAERFPEAQAALERLLDVDPSAGARPPVRLWLAECCARRGLKAEAVDHLRRVESGQDPAVLGALAHRWGLAAEAVRLYGRVQREAEAAGRPLRLKVVPAAGQAPEEALAQLDPSEALAELDPDGRRTGRAPGFHRLEALRVYAREGRSSNVFRLGLLLLSHDGGDAEAQREARSRMSWVARELGEDLWNELRRAALPTPTPAIAAETRRCLEELVRDDVQARQAAKEALRKLGTSSFPLLLEKADAADPELRSSVRELILSILTR